jgi:hypothetical protein
VTRYTASDGSIWRIEFDPPPMPLRTCDWLWVSEDYDGPGDDRCGTAASYEDAVAEVEAWVEMQE